MSGNNTCTKVIALLASGVCFEPALAQMVIQADRALLQPQIQRDADGFRSCGVRAVVLDTKGDFVDVYDFSLVVDAKSMAGMMKAGKSVTKTTDMLKGKHVATVVMPGPVNFWIAAETDGKAVESKKFFRSETNGFILATSEMVPTFKAIVDLMAGERMQFAVRYKSQSLDSVISFATEMPEVESKALSACLGGVRDRLVSEANDRRNSE